jgi:hypothetical protein
LPVAGTVPSAVGLTALGSSQQRIYTLTFSSASLSSPATNTTYYMGSPGLTLLASTDNERDIPCPITGTIVAAYVVTQNVTTNGTAETSTISIHQNNTTDITITSSFKNDSTVKFNNTGLSTAVSAGDNLCIKWVSPSSWATPPVGVQIRVVLAIAY